MKLPRFLCTLLAAAMLATAPSVAAEDIRFSKTLAATDFSASGLERLSSDQLAILDALVRRDIAQSRFVPKEPRAARFSERLTPAERHDAGLNQLTEAELLALDAHVAPLAAPPAAVTGARYTADTRYAIPSVKIRREPELHGQVSLMVAAGSDGYVAYGGGVAVTLDDPANKFALTLAYSQIHSKGGSPYRYCGDHYYGRPWGPLHPLGPLY